MKQLIVGLTGSTGGGKSTVAGLLRDRYGYTVIDADQVARQVTRPGSPLLPRLAEQFGGDILDEAGQLNRKTLASRAFTTPESALLLNRMTHPVIVEKIEGEIARLRREGISHILLDAPLLFESGADAICDVIVAVLADPAIQLERVMRRDGLTREEAQKRLSRQQPPSFYQEKADYIIDTTDNHPEEKVVALAAFLEGGTRHI